MMQQTNYTATIMIRRSARLAAKKAKREAEKRAAVKIIAKIKSIAATKKKKTIKANMTTKKMATRQSARTTKTVKTTKITTKKRSTASTKGPVSKKRRTGLSNKIDPADGVVDPESGIVGTIKVHDDAQCDVMLALVDPAKNMDKFFILQLIEMQNGNGFAVYTRWGRTGTSGQALQQDFDELDSALQAFNDKFKQKTGWAWEERNNPTKGGKYRLVQQDFVSKRAGYKNAKWQYWVDDGVDGKATGWYDYTREGSTRTERLYSEHIASGILGNRFVESGAFTYNVDLVRMTQTNVSHPNRTSRRIRRCG